ncbi:hypothetical protein LNP25_10785 [Klebsiella variicola subsp. variicola]|nr:hypothetical protein [Klebsiella variicola subsp. variicola]
MRIVPGKGKIILPENDINLKQVMAMGCWSEQGAGGRAGPLAGEEAERRRLAVGSAARRRKGW